MKKTFLYIVAGILAIGCVKEDIDLQKMNSDSFDPSFAIPLGNVTLQLGRLNDKLDRFLEVNPTTGVLEMAFQKETINLGMSDIYTVSNQNIASSASMNSTQVSAFNTTPMGSTYSFSSSSVSTFTVSSSALLDSVVLNNGDLTVSISSTYAHSASVVLTIPSLVKNGIIYSTTIPLTYSGTVPVTSTVNLSLAGYTIDLTDGGTTNNAIRLNFNTTVTKGAALATTAEAISFNSNFNLSQIEEIHGYFGNTTFNQQDTAEFDLFDNLLGGTISVANPRIEIKFLNSTGIPFDANFNSVTAIENTINQNIGGSGLTSIPTIGRAISIGDSAITNHIVDNSNTNPTLTTILNEQPSRFAFNTDIQLNSGGFTNNFLTSSSRLKAITKLVLPFNGYGLGFELSDTTFTKLEDAIGLDSAKAENLKLITLRVNATNKMPIEASVQIYFLDNNNTLLDSLFSDGMNDILLPGIVDFSGATTSSNYGKVITASSKTFDVLMTKDEYLNLLDNNQSKIVYKIRANTIDGAAMKNIKIFSEDYVKLKLSAKLDLKLSIN